MSYTVYGANWCITPVGKIAWSSTPLTVDVHDTVMSWRSREQHDPGDGPYKYWGFRKPGKLPSYNGIQLVGVGYHKAWSVVDQSSGIEYFYEILYPEEDAAAGRGPTVRSWHWGPFFWGDGWGAEQHKLNWATRHWSGTSYANKDVWYTYGSHRSLDDPPTLHWDDRSWFGVENQAKYEPDGGKLRDYQSYTFEEQPDEASGTHDFTFFDTLDLGYDTGVNNALSRVYVAACTSLPRTSMNNIANILDIVGLLKTFVGGRLDIPNATVKNIREAIGQSWMGYRYQYGTTKMDIIDGVELVERLRNISEGEIRCNSIERYQEDDTEYTFRCSCVFTSDEFSKVRTFAEKWGLALSGYNLWDMVPYSFIIDWFLDIGGLLEYYEGYQWAMRLHPIETWYSVSKVIRVGDSSETYYYRFPGGQPDTIPLYTSYTAGSATLIKRGLDIIAMLI